MAGAESNKVCKLQFSFKELTPVMLTLTLTLTQNPNRNTQTLPLTLNTNDTRQ